MAIVESKIKSGTLTFGGATPIDLSCQPTAVRLVPSTDVGDQVETLCGDILAGSTRTTWALEGTSIQDFNDPAGFLMFAYNNADDLVPFTWTPNADGPSFAGQVRVQPMEFGGDVNTRLTSDWSWQVSGSLTITP